VDTKYAAAGVVRVYAGLEQHRAGRGTGGCCSTGRPTALPTPASWTPMAPSRTCSA